MQTSRQAKLPTSQGPQLVTESADCGSIADIRLKRTLYRYLELPPYIDDTGVI